MLSEAGIRLIALLAKDMEDVIHIARKFDLDFDDAYQYVAADRYGLNIISFDSDFDRTEKGRRMPSPIES